MRRGAGKSFAWSLITSIAVLIACLFLMSCQAYKKKICMQCPTNTIIKDSIHEKEVIVHDSVPFSVPGPTVTIQSPCDSIGNLKPFKIRISEYR